MKRRTIFKDGWGLPFLILFFVMAVSFFLILQNTISRSSQDLRSRAVEPAEDVRIIPNFRIPRPSGGTGAPNVSGYPSPSPWPTMSAIGVTGVKSQSRGPLLSHTPGPTLSVVPTRRPLPRCNVVLQFMGMSCLVP